MGGVVVLLVVIVLVLWVLASCIRIVPQAYAVVLERLGAYKATWSTGIHFKVPFIERVARRVNLKEQVVDFPPQPVITKDNVTMQIDTVVFFQITDPKLYAYGVENPIMAIENLSATTLRNIIGDMELDETLTSREVINTKMRASLDVATDPWGIKVNRVELKNIIPPAAIQDAMEKQMKAERERREAILKAEGEKRSTILVAEGKKQSAILDAEAEKQASVCTFLFVLGLVYATSAIVIFFRDLTQIISIFLQVGVWLTPIMWDINMLSSHPWLIKLFKLNPMYYVVTGYRDSMLGHVGIWNHASWTIYFWVVTILLFGLGSVIFKRLKPHFADVL